MERCSMRFPIPTKTNLSVRSICAGEEGNHVYVLLLTLWKSPRDEVITLSKLTVEVDDVRVWLPSLSINRIIPLATTPSNFQPAFKALSLTWRMAESR
jgi:hypothetical protein